ncbi:hypothetical protein JTB14_034989 [Gonioctena quinquepunctata]|nr:hypothetical protein JTB14_034989 [Gonioctena quinquepunctata]
MPRRGEGVDGRYFYRNSTDCRNKGFDEYRPQGQHGTDYQGHSSSRNDEFEYSQFSGGSRGRGQSSREDTTARNFNTVSKWNLNFDGQNMGITNFVERVEELRTACNILKGQLIRTCVVCLAQKPEQKAPAGLLSGRPNISKPWETISIDVVGPLPKSSSGHCYILSISDYFSKFCLFFPMRAANSKTIIKLLEDNVFLLFGVPRTVIMDKGKPFVLQKAACAICTSLHESTGKTPYSTNFGREMCVHGKDHAILDRLPDAIPSQTLENSSERFRKIFKDFRNRLDKASEKGRHRYNLRHRDIQYNVGDKVWRKGHFQSKAGQYFSAKLAPRFIGPFTVHTKVSPWAYELLDRKGKSGGVWNVKDLNRTQPTLTRLTNQTEFHR